MNPAKLAMRFSTRFTVRGSSIETTISVTEEDGKVRLSGIVNSPHDRRRAAIAAWSHPGVVDVINDIKVV